MNRLTVQPWYWRFMVFQVAEGMIGHASMFYDTHGVAAAVPSNRTVIVWPKPAHLAVRWSMRPAMWLAWQLHEALGWVGHHDADEMVCPHPLMFWFFWLVDNVYECRWIRVSPTVTVHHD